MVMPMSYRFYEYLCKYNICFIKVLSISRFLGVVTISDVNIIFTFMPTPHIYTPGHQYTTNLYALSQ